MDLHKRISYTYVGGPLNGERVEHQVLTDTLLEPQLHQHEFLPKGESAAKHAQGMYHVELRERGPTSIISVDPSTDELVSEEIKDQGPGIEYVAIHHPSDKDQEWHVPEPKYPVAAEAPVVEKKPRNRTEIPKDHPLFKTLARVAHLLPKKDG